MKNEPSLFYSRILWKYLIVLTQSMGGLALIPRLIRRGICSDLFGF